MARPPRPRVDYAQVFGSIKNGNFWVEYPSGLVDLTRTNPVTEESKLIDTPTKAENELDIHVDADRVIRIDPTRSAFVVIDMQKYVYSRSTLVISNSVPLRRTKLLPSS